MVQILMGIAVLLALVGVVVAWPLIACGIKESDYGLNTKWSLFNGCLVETRPGIFVPADRYRGEAG